MGISTVHTAQMEYTKAKTKKISIRARFSLKMLVVCTFMAHNKKHLYVRYCRCLAQLLQKRRNPKKIKQKTIPNWIDEKQSAYISCDRIENVDIQPRTTSIWWRAQFKQSNVFLKANTYVALAFCFHLMFRLFLLHSIRFRYSLFSVFDFLSTNEKTKLIDENDSQYLCSHWKLYRLLALNPIQNQK